MFCWGISLKTKLPPRLLKVWETTEQLSLYLLRFSDLLLVYTLKLADGYFKSDCFEVETTESCSIKSSCLPFLKIYNFQAFYYFTIFIINGVLPPNLI